MWTGPVRALRRSLQASMAGVTLSKKRPKPATGDPCGNQNSQSETRKKKATPDFRPFPPEDLERWVLFKKKQSWADVGSSTTSVPTLLIDGRDGLRLAGTRNLFFPRGHDYIGHNCIGHNYIGYQIRLAVPEPFPRGPCRYGLHSYGLCSHGLYRYGPGTFGCTRTFSSRPVSLWPT